MQWYGYLCYHNIPLGSHEKVPIEDPRYMSEKVGEEIYEFEGICDAEIGILKIALREFLGGKQIQLEEFREGDSPSTWWRETPAYTGVIR